MVVALVAVLKAGAGYVPVDLAYPPDRISYMLAEARPVAILTTMVAVRDLPDRAPRALALIRATWPRFTSDDTGRPCGRPVSWAGLS